MAVFERTLKLFTFEVCLLVLFLLNMVERKGGKAILLLKLPCILSVLLDVFILKVSCTRPGYKTGITKWVSQSGQNRYFARKLYFCMGTFDIFLSQETGFICLKFIRINGNIKLEYILRETIFLSETDSRQVVYTV